MPSDTAVLEQIIAKIDSRWRVPFDGSLEAAPADFTPPDAPGSCKDLLVAARQSIRPDQRKLYAAKQFSVLLVFQALDAAGKDGVIREVFEDLDPDITVFNRSHYEEVLTVRVHPEYLEAQYPGPQPDAAALWPARYRAIREFERRLAASNTLILKFWLNVSPAKQAQRFMERLEDPKKRWKFSLGDVRESTFRAAYDEALMHMLNETSRPWAPWFCIPADDRWYLRWQVAEIVGQGLAALPLTYPPVEEIPAGRAEEVRALLGARIAEGRKG